MATIGVRGRHWMRKAREWCSRYLPAELVGTVCSVIGAYAAFQMWDSRAAAALAGTIAENAGFYGVMVVMEWRRQAVGPPGRRRRAARTAVMLSAEFGPAEAVDSLAVRPLMLLLGPLLTGGIVTGSVLGKILADVVFYIVAIVCYEAAQRRATARRRRIAAAALTPRFAAVVAVGVSRPRQGSTTGPG